ncbi:MAG: hypothetical protein NWE92_09275 [Candidatus Bathyarchaeota archaeon]|nr:hypothetical protein [Candidatus Bathyarchaeota archaeon]
MKRIIVWVDSADNEASRVRGVIKNYLTQSGIEHTIFETCEVIESENE